MTRLDGLRRFGLRFGWCYFVVYAPVVISSLGFAGLPRFWYDRLLHVPVRWTASALGLSGTVLPDGQLSGGLELARVVLLAAVALTAAVALAAAKTWSLRSRPADIDDERRSVDRLTTGVRYLLAYGTLHFALVTLLRLDLRAMTPEGLVTPMGARVDHELLWVFLGWSWVFTTFFAIVEAVGGILLLRRETALLGALVVGAFLANVVLLNFAFDVPGKTLSPHFAAMAGFLVLPHAKRLFDLHLRGNATGSADLRRSWLTSGWWVRNRPRVKTVVIALFVLSPLVLVYRSRGYLVKPDRHQLAGLYEVTGFSRSGSEIEPFLGNPGRWWRAVVSDDGTLLHVQHTDLRWFAHPIAIDQPSRRITLGTPAPSTWRGPVLPPTTAKWDTLEFRNRADDGLEELSGQLGGDRVAMSLRRIDVKQSFRLYQSR